MFCITEAFGCARAQDVSCNHALCGGWSVVAACCVRDLGRSWCLCWQKRPEYHAHCIDRWWALVNVRTVVALVGKVCLYYTRWEATGWLLFQVVA